MSSYNARTVMIPYGDTTTSSPKETNDSKIDINNKDADELLVVRLVSWTGDNFTPEFGHIQEYYSKPRVSLIN